MLLGLASSLFYGLADFAGGVLSRRAPVDAAAVALVGQLGGLVLVAVAAVLVPADPTAADLLWGAISGVGTGVGMMFLYRGLVIGRMSIVVPLVAVLGTAIPVLIGVAVLGDRPSAAAWIGIVAAVPALWLVCRTNSGTSASGSMDATISSLGIALQYVALAQAGPDAGLWPVVAGRVAAAMTICPFTFGTRVRMPARYVAYACLIGGMAALALVCYLFATRQEMVSIAVVLSSLYPVVPVVLGIAVLGERLSRNQLAGLLMAAAAVVLLAQH